MKSLYEQTSPEFKKYLIFSLFLTDETSSFDILHCDAFGGYPERVEASWGDYKILWVRLKHIAN